MRGLVLLLSVLPAVACDEDGGGAPSDGAHATDRGADDGPPAGDARSAPGGDARASGDGATGDGATAADAGDAPDRPPPPPPPPPPAGAPPPIEVREAGAGLRRVVTVEIPGELRLGFEARLGYGPTQWFDLVGSPGLDIAHDAADPENVTEQGSVANHVLYPEDYHAHHRALELFHQELPRRGDIVEQSPVRAVLECSSFPVVNHEATRDVELLARYAIYADGRIAVRSTVVVHADHAFSQWRVSVIGVGDPTYRLQWERGDNAVRAGADGLRVPDAEWPPDRWAGFVVEQPGFHIFPVLGNTADTLRLGGDTGQIADGGWEIRSADSVYGWVRGIDAQDPYTWTDQPVDYLTLRWDPNTRPPHTRWTEASAVLARWRGNEQPYVIGLHSWDGFKRHYFALNDVRFRAGQSVVQRFLLRLGTRAATALPDLADRTTAGTSVRDYLDPNGRLALAGAPLPYEPDDLAWVLPGPGTHEIAVAKPVDHPVLLVRGAGSVVDVRSDDTRVPFRAAETADGAQVVIVWASFAEGTSLTVETRP